MGGTGAGLAEPTGKTYAEKILIVQPGQVTPTHRGAGRRGLIPSRGVVDNRFFEPVGRFPTVEEDEPPLHLLTGDYRRYYRFA